MRPIGSFVYLRGLCARAHPDAYEIIAYGTEDNEGHYLLAIPGVNTNPENGPVGYWDGIHLFDTPEGE